MWKQIEKLLFCGYNLTWDYIEFWAKQFEIFRQVTCEHEWKAVKFYDERDETEICLNCGADKVSLYS